MSSPNLLILNNALDHRFYQPVEHWRRALGFVCDHIHVPSGQPLPIAGAHSHVILTGSEASILNRASWVEEEIFWVQEAIKKEVRILGSCWGHQLLAFAQGGPNCVRRSKRPEIGWFRVEVLDSDGLLPAGSFSTFLFHLDEVIPGSHPDMKVLARSEACAVQACRWGDRPVWGIQSHPEIFPEAARRLLEDALVASPDQKEIFQRVLLTPVEDSGSIKEIINNFLGK